MSEIGAEAFNTKPNDNETAIQEIIEQRLARIKKIDDRIAALEEERRAYALAVGASDNNSKDNSGDVSVENGDKNSDVREVNTVTEEGVSPDYGDPAALLRASLERQRPVVMDAEERLNKAQNPQL